MNWGRFITAMVTPFDENLNVNYDMAILLAKKLIKDGNTSLVITGTTGEAPTLSDEEKIKLYEKIKENVNVPIIAGVGTNSTKKTIYNAKLAKDAGVDGLLIVTPYYNKPNQESLYSHFKKISSEVDLPIMLYNVPGRTGCNMLPETVKKLSEIDNIVALKEASGNINQISEIIKNTSKDFKVYSGDDISFLPSMSVGTYGVVSVSSHIVGKEMNDMINAFIQGDIIKSKNIHLNLLDIFKKLFITTNPIPVKAALNMTGINVGGVRLPLTNLGEHEEIIIKQELENLNII